MSGMMGACCATMAATFCMAAACAELLAVERYAFSAALVAGSLQRTMFDTAGLPIGAVSEPFSNALNVV